MATGIRPDVEVAREVQVAAATPPGAMREKDLSGHIQRTPTATDAAPSAAAADAQLERALDLLRTWNVFSKANERGLAFPAMVNETVKSGE